MDMQTQAELERFQFEGEELGRLNDALEQENESFVHRMDHAKVHVQVCIRVSASLVVCVCVCVSRVSLSLSHVYVCVYVVCVCVCVYFVSIA